jgi:hypothetical protein
MPKYIFAVKALTKTCTIALISADPFVNSNR